jgi:uncharacterized protein YjbJ (UPF0337 family)
LNLFDSGSGISTEISDRKDRMSDEIRNKDDAKGRVKEAAGNLTGDKDLQREGKVDQTTGKVKAGVEKAADKVKDAVKRD